MVAVAGLSNRSSVRTSRAAAITTNTGRLSFVLPVIVGVLFTLLHAVIQTYVLSTLVSVFYGEAVEPKPEKIKNKKKRVN